MVPIVIPVRPPARGAGGRSATAERPAFVPPAAVPERQAAQLAQLAHVRQARLDRMAMRSVPSDPERTELAVKSLRGMLEIRMRGAGVNLPILPAIATRLSAELSSPNADMHRATDIISSDASVAAKLMQVANSAVFRGSSPVKTVGGAVVRLGIRTSNSIVMAACQKGIYHASTPQLRVLMEDLFTHSLATAIFARQIAALVRFRQPEEAFLAALLHDIACPLILRLLGELAQANKGSQLGESDFLAVMKELHCQLGASLLQKWELSPDLLFVTEHHERLVQDPDHGPLNNITFLANVLAKSTSFGLTNEPGIEALEAEGAQALGLDAAQLEKMKLDTTERAEDEISILAS
jgi:HD-like signal output (HDOD) protein